MSAPLVVNTRDGACWTRRTVTEGGVALYALADVCSCPEFVMATLPELAERGIVGSADALPMPVGPAPRSEVERLAKQVVELQDELREARFDAARARRERDVIRERVSEPYGCAHCGVTKRSHGRRYVSGAGMHGWERPADEQVKDRMLARRAARVPVGPEPETFREDGVYRNGTAARVQLARYAERTKTWSTATYDSGTERALHGMAVALAAEADASKARVAELEAAPRTVYRASHDSIVVGHYSTAAEARKHCEALVRREYEGDETTKVSLWWREDEDTVDQPEDGEQELYEHVNSVAVPGPGWTHRTGYVVTPLEVASEYDAEADE